MGLADNAGYERPARMDNFTHVIKPGGAHEIRSIKREADQRLFTIPEEYKNRITPLKTSASLAILPNDYF